MLAGKLRPFCCNLNVLTLWGRVTHICISKLTIIGSDNGLSPGRRQAIIWTNDGILLIRTFQKHFSEIVSEIHAFSFMKMHFKMSSGKWLPSCLGLNVLMVIHSGYLLGTCSFREQNGRTTDKVFEAIIWHVYDFSDYMLLMFVMAMHMVFIVEHNKPLFIITSLLVFWALSVLWQFTSKSLSELITLAKSIAYACQMFYNMLRPAQNGPHFADDIFSKEVSVYWFTFHWLLLQGFYLISKGYFIIMVCYWTWPPFTKMD